MAKRTLSPLKHAPLLYCALAFTAGLLWAFSGIHWAVGMSMLILASACLALKTFGTDRMNHALIKMPDMVWMLTAAMGIGIVVVQLHRPNEFPFDRYGSSAWVKGEITDLQDTGDRRMSTVLINAISVNGKTESIAEAKAFLPIEDGSLRIGDEVWFRNRLTPLADHPLSLNDGYAESMRRRGILYRQVYAIDSYDIKPAGHHASWRTWAASVRSEITDAVCRAPFSDECRNFTTALLSSDRSLMPDDEVRLFADSGLSHMIAISGMHVGIMAGMLWILFLPFAFVVNRYTRMVIVCGLLWVYALICGMSPPVTRACIMATSLYAAAIADRPHSSFNALWGAWLIILLADPYAIYEAGFQLSFATVGCIILFYSYFNQPSVRWQRWLAPVVLSLVATAGSWPLIAYHFHRVPLLFLPANILAIPLLPIYIATAAVCTILFHTGMAPMWAFTVLNTAYSWLHTLMRAVSDTHLVWENIWINHWVCILYYAVILAAAWVFTSKGKRWAWASLGVCSALILGAAAYLPDGRTADTLAIANNFRHINARTIIDNVRSDIYTLDRGAHWQESVINGRLIGCADCRSMMLPEGVQTQGYDRCDILIIGRTYEADPALIIERFRPDVVITSSSLSNKRYERFRQYCRAHSIPLHSLKHHGPYMLHLN